VRGPGVTAGDPNDHLANDLCDANEVRRSVAIKPIRLFGDPVLRTPAQPVVDFDKELRRLVKDLEETMLDAPGAGLAAPQIGVSLRVFAYHIDGVLGHLINPVLDLSDEMQDGEEGCLSFPGLSYDTPRALRVVARGMNMHGDPLTIEGSELLSRAIQHETDHLEGILFIDRMDRETRKLALKAIREAAWAGEPVPQVRISPHSTFGKGL
jgi:peptide deformylase